MKAKFLTLFRSVLLLTALLATALSSQAYDFEVGGIYYGRVNSTSVYVTYGNSPYSGSVTIPEQVTYDNITYDITSIGQDAFNYCTELTSVYIPNSVTAINQYAFWGCTGLTSINIPNSVTVIGDFAFEDCSGLMSIVVDSGNPIYDSRNNCNAIIESSSNILIQGCQNTIIPNTVTAINQYAFSLCTGLANISIPNSVTSIGNGAFWGCSGLTSINIPNSVTSIGKESFGLCTGLTDITIPSSISSIGLGAFDYGSGLVSITVEDGNTTYDSRDNCNAIIETATGTLITGCKNTVVPSSVTSIGDWSFLGCEGLTGIDIPNSVTSIGESAFVSCTGLTSINIPNSVTFIGDWAFQYCTGLTSVIIPNSVICDFDNHGIAWFYQCTGLTSVTIGSNITWMGITFLECPNITHVTCLSKTPPYPQPFIATIDGERIRVYIFNEGVPEQATLYVPAESLDIYQQSFYWGQFQNILPIDGNVTPGDVNDDDEINIADVNVIINIILGGEDNTQGRSDVNEDGEVNIADVNTIINIILS